MGDSGFDNNFFHDKNHLTKECMLRRMSEKKDEKDDEAYYIRKIEELRKKKSVDSANPTLIV